MAQITLRQREVALAKALRQLEQEKATFRLERDCLQRERDEPANDKAAPATKQKKESLSKDMWEGMIIAATIFLSLPVLTLGATLLAVEVVGGWRIFSWAIAVAGGYVE